MSIYEKICQLVEISPLTKHIQIDDFNSAMTLSEKTLDERATAGLQVLIDLVLEEDHFYQPVDKIFIDHYIARIDDLLNLHMDAILHHEAFQQLESLWTSLKYLVDRTDFRANIKIEILDVDKESLRQDFNEAINISESGLFKHIYDQEYDTPGGEPISAIITDYEFSAQNDDVLLLSAISKICTLTHCPLIASIGPAFFQKENFDQVLQINDLTAYMERAEYIRWLAFRETEEARYIGLTLPKFLLRLPYDHYHPLRSFVYEEHVCNSSAKNYLWGSSSFAFAANMAKSFKENGWTVNIRGPESGGKVENLPLHHYDFGRGLQTKIPSEILIPETKELEFANLGFIPLSYYKNSNFACFFSANSVQKPVIYLTPEATANSRINARLPYIFLSARLGHYLKVLQRENIGTSKTREELEAELNKWLQTLITKMNHPGPEIAAKHPLREGVIEVLGVADNPGYYKVNLFAIPHFQVEGIDVRLTLVAQLPTGNHHHKHQ